MHEIIKDFSDIFFVCVCVCASVDENECELTTDNCTGRAKCVNTIGGFYCTCPPGYQLSEDNSCIGMV